MNEDRQNNPGEFSEAIQDLRDEMQRDVRTLASTLEHRPKQKPGVPPLAVVASVLGSLFLGAAGMSLYDAKTETTSETGTGTVDVRADLQAAMAPYTQELEKVGRSLVAAQQAATDDSKAHGLLLDGLAETVTSLQRSAETQNAAFHQRVDLLADELAAKIAREVRAETEPTVAARQPIPESEASAVQPANVETDITDLEDDLVAVDEKPTPSTTSATERGELIIENPSDYDLKLLISGEPLDIKARGVTTIDITVGTVKTQIASLPDLVQNWDKWETVDGVKRLTINVESGNGYYKLR
jgi:hypothetical protein